MHILYTVPVGCGKTYIMLLLLLPKLLMCPVVLLVIDFDTLVLLKQAATDFGGRRIVP